MHSADYAMARCPSVRPSVCPSQAGIVSQRLNVSSYFFHGVVASSFQFSPPLHTGGRAKKAPKSENVVFWISPSSDHLIDRSENLQVNMSNLCPKFKILATFHCGVRCPYGTGRQTDRQSDERTAFCNGGRATRGEA